jgi:anaerobic selenocysteine-containing dehydrogenase
VGADPDSTPSAAELELLLVSRREHATYNSVGHALPALRRRRPYNPAYLNPEDARRLGVSEGTVVIIESAAGAVRAVAHPAGDVRAGVVSMAHGFDSTGGPAGAANAAALVDDVDGSDALSGLPRMSAIPVRVRLAAA